VLFWVAGFDIIYSLQDADFDKQNGLHSIPVEFGRTQALKISSYCHIATLIFLVLFGWADHLGVLYWIGVLISAILMKIEHKIIADGDLAKINTAFFMINGWIGVLLLIFTFLEVYR
jgi:4-hydroxybenzoate polyprenyltransferase